jgi:hypothetical protein
VRDLSACFQCSTRPDSINTSFGRGPHRLYKRPWGSNFYFWTENVFSNRSRDFCPRMAKGGVCKFVIGLILIGQNHLCVKMLFNRDSTIQKYFRRFCIVCKSDILVPCQPSGRRVIPSGRSSVHGSSRPNDVPYRLDAR